ncbi:MAG TPA: helix-turn-helix transcriptional regulator [Candidatus Paceibacterota bacterium]
METQNKNGKMKSYSFDQVFKKSFKSKAFRKEYNEELVRLKLAYQVRDMRVAKRLTQKTVAERAHMPQSVIARIESGTHSFSLGTLNRIAIVFSKEVQLV